VVPFTYSVEAQKPGSAAYAAALSETFQGGQKFRLHLKTAQPGHVYVVNYGPGPNGAPRYWVLHPTQRGQTAGEGVEIVTRPGMSSTTNPGTERLWMVLVAATR